MRLFNPHLTVSTIATVSLGIVLLCLLPIWVGTYFPTQDGPIHVYNAWIIRSLFRLDMPLLSHSFNFHAPWDVSAGHTWVLSALMMLGIPPLMAEKLFVSGLIGLFIGAGCFFSSRFKPNHWLDTVFYGMMAHNTLLYLGFYGFYVGLGLSFIAFGIWFTPLPSQRHGLLMSLLLGLIMLSHQFCAVITASILFVLLIIQQIDKNTPNRYPWWQAGSFACILLACISLTWHQLGLSNYPPALLYERTTTFWSLSKLLLFWLQGNALNFYSAEHALVGTAFFIVMASIVISQWTAIREASYHLFCKTHIHANFPLWLAVGCIALGCCLPNSIRLMGFFNERFFLYGVLFGWPWLLNPIRLSRWQSIIQFGLTTILVLHIAMTSYECATFSREITHLLRATRSLTEHQTIGVRVGENYISKHLGSLTSISPFMHIGSYIGIAQRDIVLLSKTARGALNSVELKPILTNNPSISPDHLILIHTPLLPFERTQYTLAQPLSSTTHIYQAEPIIPSFPPSFLSLIQSINIVFTPNAITPSFDIRHGRYTHPITDKTRFVFNHIGWIAYPPETYSWEVPNHRVNNQTTRVFNQVSAWGRDFSSFGLTLPNGLYRVTWYFYSKTDNPVYIGLSANTDRVQTAFALQPLKMQALTYTTRVTHGELIQQIWGTNLTGAQHQAPWRANGFTLIPLAIEHAH